jgi:hypothetical protein
MAAGEYVMGTAVRHYSILTGDAKRLYGEFKTETEANDALSSPDVQETVGKDAKVLGVRTLRQEGRGRKPGAKNQTASTNGAPATPAQAPTGVKPGAKV